MLLLTKLVLTNGRTTLMKQCPNCFEVGDGDPTMTFPIFQRTSQDDTRSLSAEDKEFLSVMDSDFRKDASGNWIAPLPFRRDRPVHPNNRPQAMRRAKSLDASMRKDPKKKKHMIELIGNVFERGHAEIAPTLSGHEEFWYLPLFGVYNAKKPDCITGVFDSSTKCDGLSLNSVLLSGPDLVNSLLGVLLRFRREAVAISADIQQMFYCFKVTDHHRNFLRFLWYEDNDFERPLIYHRMTAHVFGNSPSPAVSTYGLRKAVENSEPDIKQFVYRDFHVDDGLTCAPDADTAISLMKRTMKSLQNNGNLRLHKIASNSKTVLEAFNHEDLPLHRSRLGLHWNITCDSFTLQSSPEVRQYTKRGMLATIHSLYDALGFAAPVVLRGKLLFRDLTAVAIDWDDPP